MAFLNERARERLERLELASWMLFPLRRKRPNDRRERPSEGIDRAFFRVDRAASTRAAVVVVVVVVVVRECGESSLVSFRFVSPGVPMAFLES